MGKRKRKEDLHANSGTGAKPKSLVDGHAQRLLQLYAIAHCSASLCHPLFSFHPYQLSSYHRHPSSSTATGKDSQLITSPNSYTKLRGWGNREILTPHQICPILVLPRL